MEPPACDGPPRAREGGAEPRDPSGPPNACRCGGLLLATLVVLVLVVAGAFCPARGAREGLGRPREGRWPRWPDALGYRVPIPAGPGRGPRGPHGVRRSRPYPPGRHAKGGVDDYYFAFDPASAAGFEDDYCWHVPAACAGPMLEPFAGRL